MITQYLKDSAENMWQAFNGLSSYISHPGVKGESRENIVIEFLEKFLPKKYSITSGIIISAEGGQSKQQDIIIYDALTSPVICTDQYSLIPVESVYATIEVKSKFTKDELSKSVNNIRSVKELKHNSVRETSLHRRMSTPAGFVFAYTAESDIDNYIKQLDNLNSDICVSNRLNALTILDRGSIFNVNKQNILEIISFPSEETSLGYNGAIGEKGDNLMFFYLLLITTLNSIEINPPNMTIYAAKSKIHSYRPGVTIPSELLRHDMNIQLPDIGNVPLGEIPKLSKYTKEFFSIIQNSDETRKAILKGFPEYYQFLYYAYKLFKSSSLQASGSYDFMEVHDDEISGYYGERYSWEKLCTLHLILEKQERGDVLTTTEEALVMKNLFTLLSVVAKKVVL